MPINEEARCLNCGELGHYKASCPRCQCRKCHASGHTGATCTKKQEHVVLDDPDTIQNHGIKAKFGREDVEAEIQEEESLRNY
eukprot:scaffold934_cov191-Alexandrium_tamarense.AAC.25